MFTVEEFRNLPRNMKRNYLYKIVSPYLDNNEEKKTDFEMFIFNVDDGELVDFYDVIIHPEKRSQYMSNQNKKIKQWNYELKKINMDFTFAKEEMYESIDKSEAENILNNAE